MTLDAFIGVFAMNQESKSMIPDLGYKFKEASSVCSSGHIENEPALWSQYVRPTPLVDISHPNAILLSGQICLYGKLNLTLGFRGVGPLQVVWWRCLRL